MTELAISKKPISRRSSRTLLAAIAAAACGVTSVEMQVEIQDDGTVRFLDLEGGCWVIETDSERLEPSNLEEDFRVDGLFVSFRANERRDVTSTCQVGRVIELVSIGIPED